MAAFPEDLIRRFHGPPRSTPRASPAGAPRREFLHAYDLSEACVFALEHWSPAPGELTCLSVGIGKDLSIRELAEAVAIATGY